ncbi:hypothetical protein GCM10025862_20860 [Arsenicicoccus piscis]|uniref:Uncharacterized protein n=1 Tax=Arsenicicoccus piscis TaxID=673954 RepID=A0ABQ6HNN6_9MICO|nr:hypothetical protein GCM10025862_20860 [Arsenicicoccus piscis]
MPPPGGPLGREAVAENLGGRPDDRDPPESLGEQTAHGVDVLLVQVEVELVGEVVDVQGGRDPVAVLPQLLDALGLLVVLVVDLADDLLDDVLHRDQARGAAVLVHDDREVGLVLLHLAQQVVDRLAVRHEVDRAHAALDRQRLVLGVVQQPARDVLEVEQPHDVVVVLADDRDPGEAGAQEQRHPLAQRLVLVERDHVGARHHHLARQRVTELEDRVDHLALVVLDDVALLGHVHEIPQLGLGLERPVDIPLAGGERVAEGHEQPGDRSEDAAQPHHAGRHQQAHGLGVLHAEGARRHPDQGERDDQHDRRADGEGSPQPVDVLGHRDRDQHGRERLGGDPQEGGRRHVARRVAGDLDQRRGAAPPRLGELAGVVAGHPRHGGLAEREQVGDDDGEHGADDESCGHRPARKVSSS